jgi:hypothetical protein
MPRSQPRASGAMRALQLALSATGNIRTITRPVAPRTADGLGWGGAVALTRVLAIDPFGDRVELVQISMPTSPRHWPDRQATADLVACGGAYRVHSEAELSLRGRFIARPMQAAARPTQACHQRLL